MKETVTIHCMQGRLLPPVDDRIQAFPARAWDREFALARAAGVEGIEWIFEEQGESENPLGSEEGIDRMSAAADRVGVRVDSLCADWFMDHPLLVGTGASRAAGLRKLRWLVAQARFAGIHRIVLPFVDASALRGPDDLDALVELVTELLPDLDVELHLETDLDPEELGRLLGRLDHPFVKANYDTGNSASLGYDPRAEFEAYGARIGSVHVKDRVLGGGTVPLGQGSADLELVIALLRERDWQRPLVLQVARGETGQEVQTVRAAAEHVRGLWARSGQGAWT